MYQHSYVHSYIATVYWINFEGVIFVDWIVKGFCRFIFEDYN